MADKIPLAKVPKLNEIRERLLQPEGYSIQQMDKNLRTLKDKLSFHSRGAAKEGPKSLHQRRFGIAQQLDTAVKSLKQASLLSSDLGPAAPGPAAPGPAAPGPAPRAVAAGLAVVEEQEEKYNSLSSNSNSNSSNSEDENTPVAEEVVLPGAVEVVAEPVAPEAPAEQAADADAVAPLEKPQSGCEILYDPCTGIPITEPNPLKIIQKKIQQLGTQQRYAHLKPAPAEIAADKSTRLSLLLWFVNQPFASPLDINEASLLDYKRGETQFSTSLFEAYWDVAIALGLLKPFERPSSASRFLLDRKVEDLQTIEVGTPTFQSAFSQDPLLYLQKREIQTSSSGGASDITVFFAGGQPAEDPARDTCLTAEKKGEGSAQQQPPTFYFCSSKFYRGGEKSVDKYDIQNIFTAAKKIDNSLFKKEIVILVNNRAAAEGKIQSAMRQYLSEEAKYILGKEDLFAALRRLHEFLQSRRPASGFTEDFLRAALGLEKPALPLLSLRLHQLLAVNTITTAIQTYKTSRHEDPAKVNNRFLIGILPRGGKTFVAGGLVRALAAKRVVVILGAKSETFSQFVGEMFHAFLDFADYTVIDVLDDASYRVDSTGSGSGGSGSLDPSKKYIFVMSIELFKRTDLETRPLLRQLQTGALKADLFICDEGHLKQATARSEKVVAGATAAAAKEKEKEEEEDTESGTDQLDKVAKVFTGTPVVYMTGTYRKPLLAFQIPDSHTMIWDYEDLQRAKSLETERPYFQEAFGDHFTTALETCIAQGQTMDSIQEAYRKFPEIHLMTTRFNEAARDTFLNQELARPGVAGFPSIPQMFQINKAHSFQDPAQWSQGFQLGDFMQKLVAFLAPQMDPVGPPTILDDIDEVAQRVGDRLRFFTRRFVPHSQLWFLPKMAGHPLAKRLMALAGVIHAHPWFAEHFDILAVSRVDWRAALPSQTGKGADIQLPGAKGVFSFACPSSRSPSLKACIEAAEERARAAGRGLIILAQNMLHLGISLKCVDIVTLLDSGEDADERIQKMYRALTEAPSKKAGFVIDLNYFRTVSAIAEYQIQSFKARRRRLPTREESSLLLNTILKIYSINDNRPLFTQEAERNLEIEELKKRISSGQYKTSTTLVNAGRAVNQNIEEHFEFDQSTLDILSEYRNKNVKRNKEILREAEKAFSAAVAKRAARADADENENSDAVRDLPPEEEKEERNSILRRIRAGHEIFKVLIRMGTFGSDKKSLREYFEELKANEQERQDLYSILLNRNIIDKSVPMDILFEHIVFPQLEKYLSKSEGESYVTMKRVVNDPSQYPEGVDKVLKYISDHLSPKNTERQQLGEVFTPMEFVNSMLSHLPDSVWKNPDAKWLDPANGMGNFPIAVFLKLNQTLKSAFPSEKARHTHIIQNMLYMFEINSKNSKIARQLFKKIAPDVEPNIWTTDSLAVTAEKLRAKGWPERYTVIMGNPPFNRGGVTKGGGTLWPLFMDKAFEWVAPGGYIDFVHPTGWRKFYDPEDKRENQGKRWYDIREKGWNLLYLNVNDEPPRYFPVVDTYVIHASPSASPKPTTFDSKCLGIVSQGEAVLDLPFIPNMLNAETLSILRKVFAARGQPISIVYDQSFKPTVKDEGNSGIPHYHFINSEGKRQVYNKEYTSAEAVPAYINKPKVIMTFKAGYEKGRLFPFYTEEQMGTTNNSMYMLVDSLSPKTQGEKLVAFFESDPITFLMKITQYSSPPNHINEFKILNKLQMPESLDWGFTKDEQDLIAKVLESTKHKGRRLKTAKVVSKGGALSARRRKTRRAR